MRRPHPGWIEDGAPHRRRLVDDLVRAGAIRSEAVREAFATVAREVFTPGHALRHGVSSVYRNEVLVTLVGSDGEVLSSSSQPQLMAAMLENLELSSGMRVLEVGTGTGYNAALLAHIVGPSGRVVSVELDPGVAKAAREAVATGGHDVEVVTGDGAAGAAHLGPFDRVIATASTRAVPRAWLDQSVEGGLIEAPLRLNEDETQAVVTFRRDGDRLVSQAVLGGRFMPLRTDPRRDGLPILELPLLTSPVTGADPVRLVGTSVAGLSAPVRDSLIRSLPVGRRRPLGVVSPPWDLVMFVSLEVPAGRLVSRWPELSVGVLTPDGGLALVEGRRTDGHLPRPLHLVAHGPSSAEEELNGVVDRWRELGRPRVRDLEVEIHFDGERPELAPRWRPGPAGSTSY